MTKVSTKPPARKSHVPATNVGVKPLEDYVLLFPQTPESISRGGIVLPDSGKASQNKADVKAVGPGRYENGALVPMNVAAGDTVIFDSYAGHELEIDGKKYRMVRQQSIMAVVA